MLFPSVFYKGNTVNSSPEYMENWQSQWILHTWIEDS